MAESEYPKVYLYRRIVHARLFIDSHYAAAIDLDNIADEALFSKFHFIRLFKKIYGLTPHQYLIHVRIEKAMHLLRGGMPVSDTFKRTAGISPMEFTVYHQKMKALIMQKPLEFIPGCFAEKNGWR
jgi:methylphosphotriester-DNA--protein-cysteine methyltransferase